MGGSIYASVDSKSVYFKGNGIEIIHSVFSNNTAAGSSLIAGGALSLSSGSLSIKSCRFLGNAVVSSFSHGSSVISIDGGGILYSGSGNVSISDSAFVNNSITGKVGNGPEGRGAGISVSLGSVSLSVTDSAFSNNNIDSIVATGAAIFFAGGSATILNTTMIYNRLSSLASSTLGGAIFFQSPSSVAVSNSSFSKNSAFMGSAFVFRSSVSLSLESCRFSGNTGASSVLHFFALPTLRTLGGENIFAENFRGKRA